MICNQRTNTQSHLENGVVKSEGVASQTPSKKLLNGMDYLVADLKKDFMSKVSKQPDGCWIWKGVVPWHGYGVHCFNGISARAHRMSWLLFNGIIPEGLLVCHRCDVTTCVNPDHLFVGTHVDNLRDRDKKRRLAFGTRHGLSKLTEAQVKSLRNKNLTREEVKQLAIEYKITLSAAESARSRKTWKHVS